MKRVSLPVAITIGCGLIFLGLAASFLVKKGNLNRGNKPEPKETIKRTDYTDVARKTLDWIDQQRNEDGWYILERGCDYEKKTCDIVWDNKEGNKDGLIATWARLNFFEQHQDPKDLEIVKKDIDLFFDKYKDDNLSDSLWLCKITYEMAQSKYIDQTQKDKLKELCMGVEYPSTEEVKKYWLSERDKKVKEFAKANVWEKWDSYRLNIRGFDASLGYPTDLIFRYKWTNNVDDLNAAKDTSDVLMKIYKDGIDKNFDKQIVRYPEDICLGIISAIDVYKLDKEQEMLEFASETYKQTVSNQEKLSESQTTVCGLTVKSFLDLTGDETYLSDLEKNNKILINIGVDGENMIVVGDGGWFKSDGKNRFVTYKNVVENGLIVELLRN